MMAGFFSKLFGRSGGGSVSRGEGVAYKGYVIYPVPQNEGGSWRTAGVIVNRDGDDEREHHFIRADVFSGREEAEACATRKGRQIIDERGDELFADDQRPNGD